ncbi:MAG: galactokinase family protein [bacterium]
MRGVPLERYTSARRLRSDLTGRGLGSESARALSELFAQCAARARDMGMAGGRRVHGWYVPGRIEVLGKHTDYAGGSSVLAATERGFCFLLAPGGGPALSILDAGREEAISFPVAPDLEPETENWASYPMTAARRLARDFGPDLRGGRLVFASNLPPASGMSSSSAFITGTVLTLADRNGLTTGERWRRVFPDRETVADYLGAVENGRSFGPLGGDTGVGTRGGSEDHTAMMCAVPGRLVRYAYAPVRLEDRLPMPPKTVFAVASSGVPARKTGSARERYNEAADRMEMLLEVWNRSVEVAAPHIGTVLEGGSRSEERLQEAITDHAPAGMQAVLRDRLEHFRAEQTEILPTASTALREGDMETFGRTVERSMGLAEDLLGNQVPETVCLAEEAYRLGAAAASAFGAGYGGSVWALVGTGEAASFLQRWRSSYADRFPERLAGARFFITGAGPPALRPLIEDREGAVP